MDIVTRLRKGIGASPIEQDMMKEAALEIAQLRRETLLVRTAMLLSLQCENECDERGEPCTVDPLHCSCFQEMKLWRDDAAQKLNV